MSAAAGLLAAAVLAVPGSAAAAPHAGDRTDGCAERTSPRGDADARPRPGQLSEDRDSPTAAQAAALERRLQRRMERTVNQQQAAQAARQGTVVRVFIHEIQDRDEPARSPTAPGSAR